MKVINFFFLLRVEVQEPVLTRLGTNDWKKVTERMQAETQKIAKELLELYAKRARAKGHAYPADDKEMKKVDAAKHSGLGTATMFANR